MVHESTTVIFTDILKGEKVELAAGYFDGLDWVSANVGHIVILQDLAPIL